MHILGAGGGGGGGGGVLILREKLPSNHPHSHPCTKLNPAWCMCNIDFACTDLHEEDSSFSRNIEIKVYLSHSAKVSTAERGPPAETMDNAM